MEQSLRTPIKELIERFPDVGRILDAHGIGCVPCSVGTCLLSDIVEIHNLSEEEERKLLRRIAAVLFPGQAVPLPETKRSRPAGPRKISYSPPVKRLVEEHKIIMRFVTLIPLIARAFDPASEEHRRLIIEGVDFIRSYADRFHHAKEEDILFGYFDPNLDIIKVMHEDHRKGREHVKCLVDALDRRDKEGVVANLAGYATVLTEHIKKEDELLYPWMDRNLSTRQVGEMFAKFQELDRKFEEAIRKYEEFVDDIENKFNTLAEVTR
jgi:hemerythrin-like domain-containing protein